MFRVVSIIAFLVALLGIAWHCSFAWPKSDDLFIRPRKSRVLNGLRVLVFLLTLLLLEQRVSLLSRLKKLVYLLALLCFVVLAITGFYPVLVLGEHISGYFLMLHATAAPVFAGCLAVLALSWAQQCRFSRTDWQGVKNLITRRLASAVSLPEGVGLGQKIAFWLIVLLALPLILSIVLSMFPLFGTAGQHFLLDTHRYGALLFALVAIIHIYSVVLAQAKK